MPLSYPLSCIFLLSSHLLSAQLTSQDIIHKSMAYHDPAGQLAKKEATFYFNETRPDGPDRQTIVTLHPRKEIFEMVRHSDGVTIITKGKKGRYRHTVGGKKPSAANIEQYKLNTNRSQKMQNYYHYLWYLPMKLSDPGTIIDDAISEKDFFGNTAIEIKVTYTPEVGGDIWYFYFNPQNYALIGYRFYHDESANDGEYIILDGEEIYNGIKIPKSRTWYTHQEDKLLGTDILTQITIK
jgi:hypothetical protein